MQIHLIRHAHAGSRSAWDKADHKRPLSTRGEAQAAAIADALADAGIEELWTSPSLRCRQTLIPLAEATGIEVRVVDVCSHGDVIPAVVATATRRGADLEGPRAIGKAGRYVCTVEDGQVRHI